GLTVAYGVRSRGALGGRRGGGTSGDERGVEEYDSRMATGRYDVIVVGARCAGASVGMLLAGSGLRVLLLEKASFPSDTLSTHMIHESGIARLKRWGGDLVQSIEASSCPPLTVSSTDLGAFTYDAPHLPIEGNATAFCPRRTVLDHLMSEEA